MSNGGPPNKFPQWVDLSVFTTPADRANALGEAYAHFYAQYHYWPTVAVAVGEIVYLGAYGAYNS